MQSRLAHYLLRILRFSGKRGAAVVALSLGAGALEGFGLLLLIPLLALFYPAAAGNGNPMVERLAAHLDAGGIPLQLETILALFLLLLALQSAATYLRDQTGLQLRLDFVEKLRIELYEAIMAMRWSHFSATRPSDFTHTLVTDLGRVAQGTHALLQLVTSGLMALAYLAVALYMSPLFTLLVLSAGLTLGLVIRPINRRVHRLGHQFGNRHRDLLHTLQEHLASFKLTKCFGAQRRHTDRFCRQVEEIAAQQLQFQHNSGLTRTLLRLGGGLSLTLCVWLAVRVADLPLPQLLVLIYAFARLLPMINGLQQSHQQLLHMLPAFTSTEQTLNSCRQAAEPAPRVIAPQPLHDRIELDGICYSYPGRGDRPALTDICLTLRARSTTALVGPSGAGKSTLADLILGLLEPQRGEIRIDGAAIIPPAWRTRTAYVPQETFLFHDTVRANLQWAAPDADEASLGQVLEMAAADFVHRLPQGIDTVVGERGIQLSGGERQRIALARALLRRPDLLVLDEATSALDHQSEQQISRALGRLHGDLTILVIAHRPSTVRHADQVIVIDGGEVAETGSWNSCLADPESYLHQLGEGTETVRNGE